VRNDITCEKVDAIINSANRRLKHSNGIAKEINNIGGSQIQESSTAFVEKHGTMAVGQVAVTLAGNLPC
jgi:O-acetyl-ADP-ribose deacetylase (regulator of RNase III)